MDAPLDPNLTGPVAEDPWTQDFCRTLSLQHGRVREFLVAQRRRWRQVEEQLVGQVQRLLGEVAVLRQSCAQLQEKLAGRPAEAAGPASGCPGEPDPEGLFRRYEMAMCDLRELKARNADLQKHLAELEQGQSQSRRAVPGGIVDWETEKRRILVALESCEELNGNQIALDRPRIEEIMATTDRLLAEKDRQIEELRRLEAGRGEHSAAAARDEILDRDALISQERETLHRLQDEWHEKLRQAEVELSIQRAKLARQQAGFDERVRTMEPSGGSGALSADGSPAKPARGKWLSLLGLSGEDPPQR